MVNHVHLIGRLGDDVELKEFSDTKCVAKFSLATDHGYGEKKTTEWHNIIVWDAQGRNAAKYLSKGSLCAVHGRITYRSWEGKDGKKNYITEIVASEVKFLSVSGAKAKSVEAPTASQSSVDDMQIPF